MHNKMHTDNNSKLYIIITVLVVLVLIFGGYIAYDKIKQARIEKENELLQQGYLMGVEQTTIQLINEAAKCVPVPIRYVNTTVTMFALDCNNLAEVASAVLQQRAAEQAETTN